MNTTTFQNNPAEARAYFAKKMAFTTGPNELKREIERGSAVVVIDVREAEDYRAGHIPGAISLPPDKWASPEGLRHDKTNVIYCYSMVCHLAAAAAILFAERGFSVQELEGGFRAWKESNFPIEK